MQTIMEALNVNESFAWQIASEKVAISVISMNWTTEGGGVLAWPLHHKNASERWHILGLHFDFFGGKNDYHLLPELNVFCFDQLKL